VSSYFIIKIRSGNMVVIADSEHMILETNFSIMQFHKDNPISTRCEGQTSASKRGASGV
jgi:protein required for attachment to host cells